MHDNGHGFNKIKIALSLCSFSKLSLKRLHTCHTHCPQSADLEIMKMYSGLVVVFNWFPYYEVTIQISSTALKFVPQICLMNK